MNYNIEVAGLSCITKTNKDLYFALYDGDDVSTSDIAESVLSELRELNNTLFAIGETSNNKIHNMLNGGDARVTHYSYRKTLNNIPQNYYAVFYKIRKRWDTLNYYFCFVDKSMLDTLLRKCIIEEFLIENKH